MRTLFNLFGYFSFGVALLGLGSMLFGDAGFWGFLVFVLGAWFGGFWLVLGFAVGKVGRLREMLFPSTPEASLRRRLTLAAWRRSVRAEANAGVDKLRRLEHVWASIQHHLRERLSPSELTFQRYESTARRASQRALQGLEDATSLIESLGVLDNASTPGHASLDVAAARPREERRRLAADALNESERAIAALERLDLALISDLRTGSAARADDLDALAEELDRLASNAHRYVSRD